MKDRRLTYMLVLVGAVLVIIVAVLALGDGNGPQPEGGQPPPHALSQ